MASSTVTVGCKLPNGLRLRIYEMVSQTEPVMGGGFRETKIARQVGNEVLLNGSAVPFGIAPEYALQGGFALTPNVDGEFWATWLKQNADSDLVKNGIIFATPVESDTRKEAKNREKMRSGLEPLDPNKPMKGIERAARAA